MTEPRAAVTLDALLAHRAWVRAVARALVSDPNKADDVEQEVWLAAMARPPAHAASVRGWLGAVTRNVARRLGRDAACRERYESAAGARHDEAPATDLVAEAELQQRITRAVLDLDEPFRSTVLLRYFDGLSAHDIAEHLHVPIETVRSRLRRAHERLRARLDEESGGRRGAWALAVLTWRDGPSLPVPVSPFVGATAVLGGVVMKKLAAMVLLILAIGAGSWMALREAVPGPSTPGGAEASNSAGVGDRARLAGPSKRSGRPSEDADTVARSAADLPPPVDLDLADRDLDLHGTVVDAARRGVAGARVATLTYPWRAAGVLNWRELDTEVAGPATRSAIDGTFSVRLARGDAVSLRVAAAGFATIEVSMVLAGSRVRVTLRQGVRLVVALTDAIGGPLTGARVRVINHWLTSGPALRAEGTSGADGICVLDGLPPGASGWIGVEHPAGLIGRGARALVELPLEGELRKEIRIPAGRTITGRVIDEETNQPLAGARVCAELSLDAMVKTGPDGEFSLPGWTGAAMSHLRVLGDGYASDEKAVGTADRVDFALCRGFAATARIVAPGGVPVAGALVTLIGSEIVDSRGRVSDAYATTGTDGRFRVAGLRVGLRHVLVVQATGHARVRREVPIETAAVDVDLGDVILEAPHRVEGVVEGSDGTPHPGVAVRLSGPGPERGMVDTYGRTALVLTDDLGRFRFADVAPGTYEISAEPRGSAVVTAAVTVPADADVLGLRIVRSSTRSVAFAVTNATGTAVEGAWVGLSTRNSPEIGGRTDARGGLRLDVPDRATFRLRVVFQVGDERGFMPFPMRNLGPRESDVRIVLVDAAEVTGRVLDPQGAGVAAAMLRVDGPAEAESFVTADADGRFRATVARDGTSSLVFDGSVRTETKERVAATGLCARIDAVKPEPDVVLHAERIPADRSVTVLVVSPGGQPVPGATVRLWNGVAPSKPVRTDASGRVVFGNLPAWEVRTHVGFDDPHVVAEFVPPVEARAVPDGQELRLVCRAATRTTGTVVARDGSTRPYPVAAVRAGETFAWARVDTDGRFVLLLPEGDTDPVRLQVDLNADGKPDFLLDDVVPGTRDVRVVETR